MPQIIFNKIKILVLFDLSVCGILIIAIKKKFDRTGYSGLHND